MYLNSVRIPAHIDRANTILSWNVISTPSYGHIVCPALPRYAYGIFLESELRCAYGIFLDSGLRFALPYRDVPKISIHLFLLFLASFMQSNGFEYLKESCPSLQSELLKTVAGCEDDCSSGGGGGKSRRVGAQLLDGGDTNGRRVKQRT
ncbi:BTB/POZ and MATH domain-containing protein 5 [Capsicum baccatum]|uniref:BTB/POZ and MATH domain-containing protein 5 n=1 Tax=Capsicum baccatum TaxID=33114 RepID=A0A2G2VPF5_CAPBA|nr:BTB/POZ and MATH domain-containing protein 5 [Capsicum baccatum]